MRGGTKSRRYELIGLRLDDVFVIADNKPVMEG